MKKIALLSNPTQAATSKTMAITKLIAQTLTSKRIANSVFTSQWPVEWQEFTEIWIVGGDGTLHYFINHYPNNTLPLVLFPGGSGNDFHWMLYGNVKVEEQIEQVLRGSLQLVDAGLCNAQWFLNGVGIGFDGAIVNDLLGKHKLAGKASYLLSILKHIARYKETRCSISINGTSIEQDCFMISIANGKRYGGGFMVAPQALLTDELLDIAIVGRISPLKRLRYLPIIEKGEHLELPFIQYQLASQVTITSDLPLHAHVDGEYLSANHFIIQLANKKIAFVV
jgi:diacylglycerol kinase (ATP)